METKLKSLVFTTGADHLLVVLTAVLNSECCSLCLVQPRGPEGWDLRARWWSQLISRAGGSC